MAARVIAGVGYKSDLDLCTRMSVRVRARVIVLQIGFTCECECMCSPERAHGNGSFT